MIAYLEGCLLHSTENACMLQTKSGVGYEVFLPTHLLAKLPAEGEALQLYIHTQVREDAFELFGFESWDEREVFKTLITINRVGARTAIAILGVFRPDDLRQLVFDEDVLSLTQVSGIGKKTAQQVFLELKYKLNITSMPTKKGSAPVNTLFKDAVAGLSNLGYAEDEAAFVIKEVLAKEPDLELGSILRAALKVMAQRK